MVFLIIQMILKCYNTLISYWLYFSENVVRASANLFSWEFSLALKKSVWPTESQSSHSLYAQEVREQQEPKLSSVSVDSE